jgi:GntR family transcriptional repressor for pyruvate dehydrogenase complex
MIQKKKLADYVIEEIKQMLKCGELKAGDKLPDQNKFACQLGVSRLSLREALHTLQLMGVIEQQPRVGTIIINGNTDRWVTQMPSPFLSDSEATLELLEARKFIEMAVANDVIKNIDQIEIDKLESIITTMGSALENNNMDKYSSLDVEFHMLIANTTQNRYIKRMFLSVYSLMEQFMSEAFQALPGLVNDSLKMHVRIFESLKEQDGRKFVHNIKAHIDNVEKLLKNYYASQ